MQTTNKPVQLIPAVLALCDDTLLNSVRSEIVTLESRLAVLRDTAAALQANPRPIYPGDQAERIISVVAAHFHIAVSDLVGRSRREDVVWARNLATYLVRDLTHLPFCRVGKAFNRGHGTVIHACQRVADRASIDPKFSETLTTLNTQLSSTICSSPKPS